LKVAGETESCPPAAIEAILQDTILRLFGMIQGARKSNERGQVRSDPE
jgi:hypothetical protein